MAIDPGLTYYVRAEPGATFSGQVYGLVQGLESFSSGSGGSKGRYFERTALAYGYPLAPMRKVLKVPDTLEIKTTRLNAVIVIGEYPHLDAGGCRAAVNNHEG